MNLNFVDIEPKIEAIGPLEETNIAISSPKCQDIYNNSNNCNTNNNTNNNSNNEQNCCAPIQSSSSSLLLPHFTISSATLNVPTLTSTVLTTTPLSPTSSSSSSLSLSVDATNANNFSLNNHSNFISFQHFQNDYSNQHIPWCISDGNNNSFNNYISINTKQDVSVGTELSISRDLRYKKDFEWLQNFKLPITTIDNNSNGDCLSRESLLVISKTNDNNNINNNNNNNCLKKKSNQIESFKLVEKIQPKKSRTKYSKEQIGFLESAYSQNPYPDLILVESLCKTLEISKEKINIWFQNRRARSKRVYKVKSVTNSNSNLNISMYHSNLTNQINHNHNSINNNNNNTNSFNSTTNTNHHHQNYQLNYTNSFNFGSQLYSSSSPSTPSSISLTPSFSSINSNYQTEF